MPSNDTPLGGDPPIAHHFLLEVDGVEIGVFSEVEGLNITIETEDINEGGQNGYVHKLPSRMTWPNLVFKRGLTESDTLFRWLEKSSGEGFAGSGNKLVRSTGAVTALDSLGKRLRSWDLIDVFPVQWTGPKFATGENTALQEELEVAHHGFRAKTQASS